MHYTRRSQAPSPELARVGPAAQWHNGFATHEATCRVCQLTRGTRLGNKVAGLISVSGGRGCEIERDVRRRRLRPAPLPRPQRCAAPARPAHKMSLDGAIRGQQPIQCRTSVGMRHMRHSTCPPLGLAIPSLLPLVPVCQRHPPAIYTAPPLALWGARHRLAAQEGVQALVGVCRVCGPQNRRRGACRGPRQKRCRLWQIALGTTIRIMRRERR